MIEVGEVWKSISTALRQLSFDTRQIRFEKGVAVKDL